MLTDLASVPHPLRWFVSPYGLHTPAALLHDRLIGHEAPEGLERADADRLFRQVLDCLGVPFLRRWLMWSAVALGTRWAAGGWRRLAIAVWTVLSLAGTVILVDGIVTGSLRLVIAGLLLPIPSAALWGHQYGGGLIAAACSLWLAPPTILAMIGYGVYWILEKLLSFVPLPWFTRAPSSFRDF